MFLPYESRDPDGRPAPPPGPVVAGLIAAAVVAFVLQQGMRDAGRAFGYLPGSGPGPGLLTHMFVHGGLAHLAGNMLFLYVFGPPLEARLGGLAFAVVYLLSGLGAVFVHTMAEGFSPLVRTASDAGLLARGVLPVVGASGAISGIMAAAMVHLPAHRVAALWFMPPFAWGSTVLLPGTLVIMMGFGNDLLDILYRTTDGVAHWAHLGGAGFGLLMALGLTAGEAGGPAPAPAAGDDAERMLHLAHRLYVHGRLGEAVGVLRELGRRPLPPDLALRAEELFERIRLRLLG